MQEGPSEQVPLPCTVIFIVRLAKGSHPVNQAQMSARGEFSRVLDQESGSLEVITGMTCSSEMLAAERIYLLKSLII